jgi:transposase
LANSVVHLFFAKAWAKRKIARVLGIARNTVRLILKKWERQRDGSCTAIVRKHRDWKIAPWLSAMQDLLTEYPRITAVRMHEELTKKGFSGGHTIVKDACRLLRRKPRKPVIRFETGPGEQAQMDWADCTIQFSTGLAAVKCFLYVLGFSRRMYVTFCLRADFFSCIRRHVEAFKHFDGCAHSCLYDNMKTVVLRWELDVPIYNPRFLVFASHYGFRPRACRPRCPQTKGKVERPVDYVRKNLLNARRFHNLSDLIAFSRHWSATTADVRTHGTTQCRPIDLWEHEENGLLPLPTRPYDTCQVAYKIVSPEGLVSWGGNFYSVPPAFLGEFAIARGSDNELVILSSECKEIARHELVIGRVGQKQRLPEHRIASTKRGLPPLDLLRERFLGLGDFAAPFLIGMAKAHPTTLRTHICHLLQLRETYDSSDVVAAIKHALEYNAFNHAVVEHILAAKAKPRSLEAAIAHAGNAPAPDGAPTQRDATYYENLFATFAQGGKGDDDEAAGAGPDEPYDTEAANGEDGAA